jgi:hypothetical protein
MIRSHRELARSLAEALAVAPDPRLTAGAAAVEEELARTARDRFERGDGRRLFHAADDAEIAALIIEVAELGFAIWREASSAGARPVAGDVAARIVREIDANGVASDLVQEVVRAAAEAVARDLGSRSA